MEAADPLDRDNLPASQPLASLSQHSLIVSSPVDCSRRAASVFEPEPGAAACAGDILRMEPSVRRGPVFGHTVGTGRKDRHRGAVAVKWRCEELREPGAAIGATRECVCEPSVRRILKLRQTLAAGCQIGCDRDQDISALGIAFEDLEGPVKAGIDGLFVKLMDFRRRRSLAAESGTEGRDIVRPSFHMSDDPLGRILYPSHQVAGLRQPGHERAEPHSLNPTEHAQPNGNRRSVLGPGRCMKAVPFMRAHFVLFRSGRV